MHTRGFRRFGLAVGAVIGIAGCADGGGPADTADDSFGDATSGGDTTTSTSTTATSSVSASTTSTNTTTGVDTGDTSADSGSDSGDTTGCPPGTQGCPCDAGACDSGLACEGDVCQGSEVCAPDPNEANNDETSATFLGDINDSDDNGGSVSGVLEQATDADWYTYNGDDDIFNVVDPTRGISADGGLRLCKFFECVNGLPNTELECPDGTDIALSPVGRPGCCSSAGFEVTSLNCNGTSEDSAAVFMRIDQAQAQCVNYTIDYHY